jgi:hypothetical protein
MSHRRTPAQPIPDDYPFSLAEDARLVLLVLVLSVASLIGWAVAAWVIGSLTGFSLFS